MTDKQIIDGVDVSKCSWYKQGATGMICADWLLSNDCSKNLNCYYKQLKRKERECKNNEIAYRQELEISNQECFNIQQQLIDALDQLDKLKTENERYKRFEPFLSRLLEHCNIPDKEKSVSPIDYVNNLINENEKLKIKLMQQDEVNTFFNTPIEGWNNDPCGICEHKQNYTQLKTENEELKKKVSYYEKDRVESHKTNVHNLVLIKRYKQALDEIKKAETSTINLICILLPN